MLRVLQKEYTLDLVDFSKWQEMLKFRKTFIGQLSYYFGKFIALTYIIRLCVSSKQMVYPVYNGEMIDRTLRLILSAMGLLNLPKPTDPQGAPVSDDAVQINVADTNFALTISIQYLILMITIFLIVINIRGFFKKLLVTLK